ncbi:MAG TPA: hypothetical protein VFV28_04510, partial [Limnobacter sp.]|nr:hypothetical protein [Limnobacter sp.]
PQDDWLHGADSLTTLSAKRLSLAGLVKAIQRESQVFARKPVFPFLKFNLTHLAPQKSAAVSRCRPFGRAWRLNLKRADFPEGEALGISLLNGLEYRL